LYIGYYDWRLSYPFKTFIHRDFSALNGNIIPDYRINTDVFLT